MAEYRLLTIWRFDAPLEAVYAAIHNALHWPDCGRACRKWRRLRPVIPMGSTAPCVMSGKGLPYRMALEERATRCGPRWRESPSESCLAPHWAICVCPLNAFTLQRAWCLFRSAPHRRPSARLLALLYRTSDNARRRLVPDPALLVSMQGEPHENTYLPAPLPWRPGDKTGNPRRPL